MVTLFMLLASQNGFFLACAMMCDVFSNDHLALNLHRDIHLHAKSKFFSGALPLGPNPDGVHLQPLADSLFTACILLNNLHVISKFVSGALRLGPNPDGVHSQPLTQSPVPAPPATDLTP